MNNKHWLQQFAENYSGSGDVDLRQTMDGSEITDEALEDPKNNGGVYQDNKYYPATMSWGLDVHDSQNSFADKNKPNPSRSDEYSDFPYGEQAVDDNHANMGSTASLNDSDDDVAGGGSANFTHHAPDSPAILNNGHPLSELQEDEGVNNVINNVAPNAPQPGDSAVLEDYGISEKDPDKISDYPEINKGRTLMSSALNPFAKSAREISVYDHTEDIPFRVPNSKEQSVSESDKLFHVLQPAPINGKTPPGFERFSPQPFDDVSKFSTSGLNDDGTWGNVDDIMYPDETDRKHRRSTEDFGSKDETGTEQTMANEPFKGYSGSDEESMLYSGIQPSAHITLRNLVQKLNKIADYTPVMPSANPNSGPDDDNLWDDKSITQIQPDAMIDGKNPPDNSADKQDDPWLSRKNKKWNRTEDTQDYFNSVNSGGAFGQEGYGDFSGVQPGN